MRRVTDYNPNPSVGRKRRSSRRSISKRAQGRRRVTLGSSKNGKEFTKKFVLDGLRAGIPVKAIAAALGIGERRVRTIRQELRAAAGLPAHGHDGANSTQEAREASPAHEPRQTAHRGASPDFS